MSEQSAAEFTGGHLKPDAGGIIRMGIHGPDEVFLSSQRFSGTETVDMDLTAAEAVRLGKYLTRLGRTAQKEAGKKPRG